MPTDIVMPHGDEEKFLEMAEELGYDKIIFLYQGNNEKANKKNSAYLADKKEQLDKYANKYEHIFSEKQWGIEDKRVSLVFNLEESDKKDFVHHRASGMDHVLGKQAAENDTKIAFAFSQMFRDDRDIVTGRMMQNVRICRKYNAPIVLASFAVDPYEMRSPKDLEAWGRTLGMEPKEAKQALERL